eukprot:RCo011238
MMEARLCCRGIDRSARHLCQNGWVDARASAVGLLMGITLSLLLSAVDGAVKQTLMCSSCIVQPQQRLFCEVTADTTSGVSLVVPSSAAAVMTVEQSTVNGANSSRAEFVLLALSSGTVNLTTSGLTPWPLWTSVTVLPSRVSCTTAQPSAATTTPTPAPTPAVAVVKCYNVTTNITINSTSKARSVGRLRVSAIGNFTTNSTTNSTGNSTSNSTGNFTGNSTSNSTGNFTGNSTSNATTNSNYTTIVITNTTTVCVLVPANGTAAVGCDNSTGGCAMGAVLNGSLCNCPFGSMCDVSGQCFANVPCTQSTTSYAGLYSACANLALESMSAPPEVVVRGDRSGGIALSVAKLVLLSTGTAITLTGVSSLTVGSWAVDLPVVLSSDADLVDASVASGFSSTSVLRWSTPTANLLLGAGTSTLPVTLQGS